MSDDHARRKTIRILAILCGICSLAVVALSAYLRLDAAGLGCANWPACYGSLLASPLLPLQYGSPRLLHRLVASLDLVLACFLLWRCMRPYSIQPATRHAMALLLLILLLAALGFFSADPRRALVGFLNIIGGMALVVFSWRVAVASALAPSGAEAQQPVSSGLFIVAGVTLALTVALGGWLGATYSAAACLSLPACNGVWWPQAAGWAALNPFVTLSSAPPPGDPGAVGLHLLHRALALVACLATGALAVSALSYRSVRGTAILALLLLVLVAGLGGAAVSSGLSLWLVVGHGIAATLLLAAVADLSSRYRIT